MLYNAYNYKLSGNSKKDASSYLNIMVAGSAGSGKTAFVRTFCETLKHDIVQGTFKESKPMILKGPLRSTEDISTVSMQIEQMNHRTYLTLIDTPGFHSGPTVEQQLRYIVKYIDRQFERTFAEENKVKRDAKALDTHVHCCLFFLDIKSINELSTIDKYLIKMLSSRVNIVPVIGKSDTLTETQRAQLKSVFKKEIFDTLQIPIYGTIEVEEDNSPSAMPTKQHTNSHHVNHMLDILQEIVDEDKDEDAIAMIDYLHKMPFTLVSYEEDTDTGYPIQLSEDSSVLGRQYPWAVVECCNPIHCDFSLLKYALLGSHRDMLRIDTFERFYEQYRTERLMSHNAKNMTKFRPSSATAVYY